MNTKVGSIVRLSSWLAARRVRVWNTYTADTNKGAIQALKRNPNTCLLFIPCKHLGSSGSFPEIVALIKVP
ncbi:hypothetical protein BgiMline_006292, partial [Biomphalaria glabrata]